MECTVFVTPYSIKLLEKESSNSMKTYNIYTGSLGLNNRKTQNDVIISKDKNEINMTFTEIDTLEKFEIDVNSLRGKSFLYSFKKRFFSSFVSLLSVIVIMFALIASSIYEDLFKKIIFELPFLWEFKDSISLVFVLFFFFGILIMPSLLDTEGNDFRNVLFSWFNKDIRKLERLKSALNFFDKDIVINLYNIDIFGKDHWIWNLLIKILLKRFNTINFYIRVDNIDSMKRQLKLFDITNINLIKNKDSLKDVDFLLSLKEQKLYSLMQLSSTLFTNSSKEKKVISLELFEYCGKNFFENEEKGYLVSGFQNFINRSFDDFYFITRNKSFQIYFTNKVKYKSLNEEHKRLSYYLRNHIEDCISCFDKPISLLILYYYVKDIVLEEKRTISILEKFIETIVNKQQYEFIDEYWFSIAGEMFDCSILESFELSSKSLYKKLSIKSLDHLAFLFERNGHFNQALLINKYLYEINPNKYAVNICSTYERMGNFDKAYKSLPKTLEVNKNKKASEIEIRYYQRKAWVIVSQRKEELKTDGLESLRCLKKLLFSHNEDNEALWLWHYYNIEANYSEWNGNYNESIQYYSKCLSIPSLGSFEYGATFVNMAIAYRLNYLENKIKDIELIDKSIKLGNLGLNLKSSVGDRDEMPVVLHNQALNILSKMIFSPIDEKACLNVIEMTHEAILILESTQSNKKLIMLLIENIIAKALLKKEYHDIEVKLINQMKINESQENQQAVNLYKEFYNLNKINQIKSFS